MKLFGKKKKAPSPQESIMKLRETSEMLEKREAFLQQKADAETVKAKQMLQAKNKRAAVMCLKRKKNYEGQIEKLGNARMNIEQQVMVLEGANVNFAVVDAMKGGADSIRGIHKNMKAEDVDNVMDDIREEMDVANEVFDAIGQPLNGEAIDETDLDSELAELEQENLDEQLLKVDAGPLKLPAVPAAAGKAPAAKAKSEEDELAQLEAQMAM